MAKSGLELRLQKEREHTQGFREMASRIPPRFADRHLRLIAFSEKRLAFFEWDAQVRKDNPSFQQAQTLFAQGYRLECWGNEFGNLTGSSFLTRNGEVLEFWALESPEEPPRDDTRYYRAVGLDCSSEATHEANYWVLWHLDNLTFEEQLAQDQP